MVEHCVLHLNHNRACSTSIQKCAPNALGSFLSAPTRLRSRALACSSLGNNSPTGRWRRGSSPAAPAQAGRPLSMIVTISVCGAMEHLARASRLAIGASAPRSSFPAADLCKQTDLPLRGREKGIRRASGMCQSDGPAGKGHGQDELSKRTVLAIRWARSSALGRALWLD